MSYGARDSISYYTAPKRRDRYRVDLEWMDFRNKEEKQKVANKLKI